MVQAKEENKMTVELLQTLSIVAYIAAGVLLLVAIALFFLLDVPKLYGDVSGKTAKKAIEAIRQQNETTGNKAYKPSAVNVERGKLTDKITPSGKLQSRTDGLPVSVGTEKFATSTLAPQGNETTILEHSSNETTILAGEVQQNSGETAVLFSNGTPIAPSVGTGKFSLEVEMNYTGASEIIE